MATSNFLQFNPTLANQETDAEYLVDSTRTGGAGVDAIWPSPSANKTLYQASTAITALMQMMANKGFTVSDASLSALTAQLSNILTTADLLSNLQYVTWASSIVLNAARYNGFEIFLSGNSVVGISGQAVGQVIVLMFVQDGTGGHTVTYTGDLTSGSQPDPTANAISSQIFKVNTGGGLQPLGPMVSYNGMSGMALGAVNPALVNAAVLKVAGIAPNGQVLTGNGTSYIPVAAPGFTAGSNSNGNWQQDPTGLYHQRGVTGGIPTGGPHAQFAVTFPTAFIATPVVVCTVNGILGNNDGGNQPYPASCYPSDVSTTGFTVNVACAVQIGGSGFNDIVNSVQVIWMAEGF